MTQLDRYSGGALLAVALAVLIGAAHMPIGTPSDPGPGLFPFVGAILLGILSTLLIVLPTQAAAESDPPAPLPDVVKMLAALCLYALAFEPVGYPLSTVGLLAFILYENKQTIAVILGLSIGLSAATYYTFAKVLGVALPPGLLMV